MLGQRCIMPNWAKCTINLQIEKVGKRFYVAISSGAEKGGTGSSIWCLKSLQWLQVWATEKPVHELIIPKEYSNIPCIFHHDEE